MFCTISYLRVPIVPCPYHSFSLVYADKHLYEKYLNYEQYENNCNQFCTIVYLWISFVMKFLLCTPTRETNNMIREIVIYACILELKITVSGHRCYYVFPLS